jgi:Ca2+/H+ antiporter, TMEM165/GDT1 family
MASAAPPGETFDLVAYAAGDARKVIAFLIAGPRTLMEALLTSFGLVAIAEIGDKTQLLAFVLAARYRGRPWQIIAGILVATVCNHLIAAAVGDWIALQVPADWLRGLLGASFAAFACWALLPDRLAEDSTPATRRHSAFAVTTALFFLAEIGDKTQLATVALGARYADLWLVALGTTLGMMAANVPAVLVGHSLADRFPLARMRFVAAALFGALAVLVLLGVDFGLGSIG